MKYNDQKRAQRYREAVAKAKRHYASIRKHQLAIGKLVYENCDVIVGGHVSGTMFSIAMFSEDTGIHRKVLNDYLHNYQIHLLAKEKLKDKVDMKVMSNQSELNKIRKILRSQKGGLKENLKPTRVLQAYHETQETSDDERKFAALTRGIRHLEFAVCHEGVDLEFCDQADIARVLGYARNIVKKLEKYEESYVLPDVRLRKLATKPRKRAQGKLLQLRKEA